MLRNSPKESQLIKYFLRTVLVLTLLSLYCANEKGSNVTPETFINPPEISSSNGELDYTLTAQMEQMEVGGQQVFTKVYNGLYIPPTLRVYPGDVMKIKIVNLLDEPTNIHDHGAAVLPLGNGDNVFNHIMPGQTYDQEVVFPPNHAPGLLWYHPHMHGLVEEQIFSGMSGALIVEGILDPFPQLKGIKERVMLLKDIQVADNGQIPNPIDSGASTTRTINGMVNPTIKIRPGETQFWRIGNLSADIYYRLKLDGHVLYEIGRDGNIHNQIVPLEEILMPPASRVEVLVQGAPQGVYQLRTLPVDEGPEGDQYPEVTLATVISEGSQDNPIPLSTLKFPPVDDLRNQPIANHRTFVFSETPDGNTFFINGKMFDENRIDTTVELGTVEEWTLLNTSGELHAFHIHQVHFQVTEINGVQQPFVGLQDVVNLPYETDKAPGEVKILIPFTDPVIVGKFVYHCHITAHEDAGMMAVIEVVQ